MKPFDSNFLKTYSADANDLLFTSTMTQRKGIRAYKTLVATLEDVFSLKLNVANVDYKTLVRIFDLATSAYDDKYDAPYNATMIASTPKIYSLIGSGLYALKSVPVVSTVPIGIRIPQAGTYSFNWDLSHVTTPVSLTVKVTGMTVDMSSVNTYEFSSAVSGDISNRFQLNIFQKVFTGLENDLYTEIRVFGKD